MSALALVLQVSLLAAADRASVAAACAGAETAVRQATEALERGRWAEAEQVVQLLSASHPDCPDALVAQGRIASRKGQWLAARQALERAARLDPGHVGAAYHLGIWLFRARQHPQAARQFEMVVQRRPADARAYDYLALSLEAQGDPEGAEAAYRRGLAANAGASFDPLLPYNYGRLLLKLGRLEESRKHLDRAVELLPTRRGPHYERAKLHLARKDYAAARGDAERALAVPDPAGLVLDLQVYYLLATVYARLGETELARKYAELSRTTAIPDQTADRPR